MKITRIKRWGVLIETKKTCYLIYKSNKVLTELYKFNIKLPLPLGYVLLPFPNKYSQSYVEKEPRGKLMTHLDYQGKPTIVRRWFNGGNL